MKRIAVTGASGMVGRHVLKYLSERGVFQMTTSRTEPNVLPRNAVWSHWNLNSWQDEKFFDTLFPEADAIFHVGAMVPNAGDVGYENEIMDANVRACLNLGLWALKRKLPIVFLSGAVVYANPLAKKILETDEKTKGGWGGFYGYSKLLAEEIFHYLSSQGLKVSILRPSSIYGAGLSQQKMICKFLQSAATRGEIELHPPLSDRINLIHATDVAAAMWQALQAEAWETFNICEKTYSVFEIAQECVSTVGSGRVRILDNTENTIEIVRFDLDCRKAHRELAFSAEISLREGLRRMWDVYSKSTDRAQIFQ